METINSKMVYYIIYILLGVFSKTAGNIVYVDNIDFRIVGGTHASVKDVPYQISIEINDYHVCGGSIISTIYILTAGHCVFGEVASELSIRAGTSVKQSCGVVITVEKYVCHPKFNYVTLDYDIAVIALVSSLTFNSKISAIPLAPADYVLCIGKNVLVTGFGSTFEGERTYLAPPHLRQVTLKLISWDECKPVIGERLTRNMICAGIKEGGIDGCQGDSGGPMVINGILVGVVSFGYGCGRENTPGVYTHVSLLRDFITEVTGL